MMSFVTLPKALLLWRLLVLLALVLNGNSFAMQCYTCQDDPEKPCDAKPKQCPTTASMQPYKVSMACIAVYGESLDKYCTPLGQAWNEELGGADRCKEMKLEQLVKMAAAEGIIQGLEAAYIEKINETMGGTLKAGEQPTPEQIRKVEEAFEKEEEGKGLGRSGKMPTPMFKVCSCSEDLCNSDERLAQLPLSMPTDKETGKALKTELKTVEEKPVSGNNIASSATGTILLLLLMTCLLCRL